MAFFELDKKNKTPLYQQCFSCIHKDSKCIIKSVQYKLGLIATSNAEMQTSILRKTISDEGICLISKPLNPEQQNLFEG